MCIYVIYMCIYVCIYAYVYVYTYKYMCIYLYMCAYMCMRVYIYYVYIYICLYTYIYMCIYVCTHSFWAHGCSMGWASLRVPPRPRARPLGPPAPPQVNLLTRSLRELTRSLRGGLCSVPKGREAIATGVPQRGPGEEGQVQRGPGGLFRWRGTA